MYRVFSPAKVNLFLKVLNKRLDGYHEVITLLQTIDLGDYLTFLPADTLQLSVPDSLPRGENNLIYRAASLFYATLRRRPEIAISVEKNTPMEAGLGGGSSNAAVTLRTLNVLHGLPFTYIQLVQMAAALGSDVPFFLKGGTAWGKGRGEALMQEEDLSPVWVRVIKPPFGLSTAEVYSRWKGPSLAADWEHAKRALAQSNMPELMFNDLESIASAMRPEITELKHCLLRDGAASAMLSGSGSAVFGVYYDKPDGVIDLQLGFQQWLVRTLPAQTI